MKAYCVRDNNGEAGSVVVFAETRGKAIAYALSRCEVFEGIEWTEVSAKRYPDCDKHYRNKREMDWFNDEDRIILVRDHGWYCIEPEYSDCESCPAKQWCRYQEDYK